MGSYVTLRFQRDCPVTSRGKAFVHSGRFARIYVLAESLLWESGGLHTRSWRGLCPFSNSSLPGTTSLASWLYSNIFRSPNERSLVLRNSRLDLGAGRDLSVHLPGILLSGLRAVSLFTPSKHSECCEPRGLNTVYVRHFADVRERNLTTQN